MHREDFFKKRKTGIGGSDVPAIMGLSPWKTPLDVYKEKTEEKKDKDSAVLRRGRDLEESILEEYSLRTGSELLANLPMVRDQEYPFLIGNIDAK